MEPPLRARDRVFISYSLDDKVWLERLLTTLSPLVRTRAECIWWDGLIKPGQLWHEQIRTALDAAKVAVFLVSQHFLASKFILDEELPRLLEANRGGHLTVLWSLVRNCAYDQSPLNDYQAVPRQTTHKLRALNAMSEPELDDALLAIAREIAANLAAEPAAPGAPPPPRQVPPPRQAAPPPERVPQRPGDSSAPARAKAMVQDVDSLKTLYDLGDFFVLRMKWADARLSYDRLLDLAAARGHEEVWMALGYEKLGAIYRKLGEETKSRECWLFARMFFQRSGYGGKAAEMEQRLQRIPARSAAALS